MSNPLYKVGDVVRLLGQPPCNAVRDTVTHIRITAIEDGAYIYDTLDINGKMVGHCTDCVNDDDLAKPNGENKVTRRTFRLLKDSTTAKKGALYQEECDDGTQPYRLITPKLSKYDHDAGQNIPYRNLVEDQPNWFVEVFQVSPQYMTKEELEQFETFKASLKPKSTKKKVSKK